MYFIKKALGLKDASQKPGHASVGTISARQIFEIAKVKQADSPSLPLQSICRSISGTCRSMGIQVVQA
jgi:large subunit ribosomal protein L11